MEVETEHPDVVAPPSLVDAEDISAYIEVASARVWLCTVFECEVEPEALEPQKLRRQWTWRLIIQ